MHGSEDDEDARRELLRLMDQHPSGQQQQEPPPLPLPNPLPFLNAKKKAIFTQKEGWVDIRLQSWALIETKITG